MTILAASAIAVPLLAQGARRDGKWEVTMQMEMDGMPQMMPPTTSTHCVTPEEARDPQKTLLQSDGRGRGMANCKVSDAKHETDKVSWSFQCDGPPPTTGTGEMVYSGDTYTGTIRMDRSGRSMTMKYTGKRLGDCDKK
jgi:hypothetical protein